MPTTPENESAPAALHRDEGSDNHVSAGVATTVPGPEFVGPHDWPPAWPASRPGENGRAQDLRNACRSAGVELGMYDERIVDWLAGWDYGTCRVVADLIRRAGAR